jgi:hypothetical protein
VGEFLSQTKLVRLEFLIVMDPDADEPEINGLLDRVSLSNKHCEKMRGPNVGERENKELDEENVATDVGLISTDVAFNNPPMI